MKRFKKTKTEFGYMYRGFYIEKQDESGYNWRRGDWLIYSKNYWEPMSDIWTEDFINCDVPKRLKDCISWIDANQDHAVTHN